MKRSKFLRPATIGLIGASAFALAACQEDPPEEVNIFSSAQECQALPGATVESCEAGYKEALAQHEQTAPRYDSLEYCEEQHGVGNCGTPQVGSEGGGGMGIFMPLLMGYMMGRMLGGGGGFASKPLYGAPGGGMTTADKSASFGAGAKSGKVSAGALAPAKSTVGTPPMSKATAASRGGFGGAGASSGSSGG